MKHIYVVTHEGLESFIGDAQYGESGLTVTTANGLIHFDRGMFSYYYQLDMCMEEFLVKQAEEKLALVNPPVDPIETTLRAIGGKSDGD